MVYVFHTFIALLSRTKYVFSWRRIRQYVTECLVQYIVDPLPLISKDVRHVSGRPYPELELFFFA